MRYIIGIDGGGTKTLGYIGNDRGEIVYKYIAGASNYHSVGIANTRTILKDVIDNLCSNSGVDFNEVKVFSFGMAGYGRENDKIIMKKLLSEIGLNNEVIMNSDAFTSLVGALGNKKGIVTICGTGSISMGIDFEGNVVRAGGWGHIISDEGSGYSIGRNCLKAIMNSFDGIEKNTMLSRQVLDFLNLKSEIDIISYLYDEKREKKDIASIAPIVFKAAEEGDDVSNRIVNEAVNSLIIITQNVIGKLNMSNTKIVTALDGGILKNVDIVRKRFSKVLLKNCSDIEIINPIYDGGVGAFLVGIEKLNANFDIVDLKINI